MNPVGKRGCVASRMKWQGGKVSSHEELDRADAKFWREAGAAERFLATVDLAYQAWDIAHPGQAPHGFGRGAYGVRKAPCSVSRGRRLRG
jgi:hypothetical protein